MTDETLRSEHHAAPEGVRGSTPARQVSMVSPFTGIYYSASIFLDIKQEDVLKGINDQIVNIFSTFVLTRSDTLIASR